MSDSFLKDSKIPVDQAIGLEITISCCYKFDGENEYYDYNGDRLDWIRVNVVNKMKIVGIYNSLYKSISPLDGYGIVSRESIYCPKYNVDYKEIEYRGKIAKRNILHYEEDLNNLNNKEGNVIQIVDLGITTDYMFFSNFKNSHMAYDDFIKNYGDKYNIFSNSNVNYIDFHNTIDTITSFLLVISIVIFIVSLLNCFEIIGYNVLKKQKNFGMYKAIGLNDKGILKLHIMEFSILLFRASIISLIVSFLPAIGLTIYGNKSVNYEAIGFDVGFHINIVYYFISLVLVIGIMYLLIYLYLVIVTRKIVKNKAITLLKGLK